MPESDTEERRLTESPGPGGIDDPIFDIRKSIHKCSFNLQFSFCPNCTIGEEKLIDPREARRYK